MVSSVGRLQSQHTTARLSQFIRYCLLAAARSVARTCSRKRNRPPGRRTRRISRTARGWSSTPQSTNVETTASKVSSSKGRSSAGARSTMVAARLPWPALESSEHEDVRLGDGQRTHGRRVVAQIGSGPRTDLQHSAGCLGDQCLAHIGKTGFLGPPHLAVVHGGEEPVSHRAIVRVAYHHRRSQQGA